MIMVHNRDQREIYENPLIKCTITGLMAHIEKPTEKLLAYIAAQIPFNNNNVQSSNIKWIGNRRHGFWHMALSTPFSILS